jgi:RNA polymerase sigma factor (sigma-70 family)
MELGSLSTGAMVGLLPAKREAAKRGAPFDGDYLARLRKGDNDTAHHFNGYFRRLVHSKISGMFDQDREEDLIDKVMTAALERILRGEPRDATRLVAYVYGICSNLTKTAMRPGLKRELDLAPDCLCDGGQSAEERLLAKEKAKAVRNVLDTLNRNDRAVLIDICCHEIPRDEVCRTYNVTREHLRLILFRARRKFQREWGAFQEA